jgi:hypothetical protein
MTNYKNSFRNTLMALLGGAMLCVACEKDNDPDNVEDEPKSAECDIISFSVNGEAWSISGTNISKSYPKETEETTLTPAITLSPGATVNPPASEAQNFFTEQGVTYAVTAEDGVTIKTYIARATVEPGSNGVIQNNTITAVNENGTDYGRKIETVKAEAYSESDDEYITLASAPYTNGGFTLKLPESLNDKFLYNFADDYLDDDYEGITLSNPNVKGCEVDLTAYESDDDIGSFYHRTENSEWNGELYYVEADLSITGFHTDEYGTSKYSTKFSNFYLKKGWNIMYFKHTEKRNSSGEFESEEREFTTQVPEGAKWHFNVGNWYEESGSLHKQVPSLSAKQKHRFLSESGFSGFKN